MSKSVFIVVRTEGQWESQDYPVRAFNNRPVAEAFAEECRTAFERQHELFKANRDRHGDAWWKFDFKKTDAIAARYQRKLPDRDCSVRDSDVSWGIWEVPFAAPASAGGRQ